MRIILIEDENDIRDYMKEALRMHDKALDIFEARNGMEGVRQIALDPPDGIILDMLMPDMDGWEFLQIMDAMEFSLPIVILTAIQADNASLCGIRTQYENVLAVENKPINIEGAGRILETLRAARKD